MLERMFLGAPPARHDRVLDFSTAVTGSLFFVPSADLLDDPPDPPTAVGAEAAGDEMPAPAATAVPSEHDRPTPGSLGIGDLRGTDD
jgi:putative iron-dependent peroxidase